MKPTKCQPLAIKTEPDILLVRQAVRTVAKEMKFGIVDQTKLVTAASELARNTLIHGGGGTATIQPIEKRGRQGLELIFVDEGPGIEDVEAALTDGYTSGGGLGLGLGGSRRLVNEFWIDSTPGEGTCVRVIRWI